MKNFKYLVLSAVALAMSACSVTSANPYQYKDFTYYSQHLGEAKAKYESCKAKVISDIGKPPSDPKLSQQYFFKKEQYLAAFRASEEWPECSAAAFALLKYAPKDVNHESVYINLYSQDNKPLSPAK